MAINQIFDGYRYSVPCSHPTTPVSGGPVRFGVLNGVAITDEGGGGNSAANTTVDFGPKTWDLSVKGVDDNGNSAVADGDALFYVDADTPVLSKKSSGYFFGIALEAVNSAATATINVFHCPSPGAGTLGSGTVGTANLAAGAVDTAALGTAAVTAAKLTATMQTGYIPLDITTARIIGSNAIGNTTEGGVPDGNTDPILARVNGATDKALRLTWAASSAIEIQFAPIAKPADMDDTAAASVHFMFAKDTNTDTGVVMAVSIWDGVGDSNAGGNTAALAAATLAEKSVTFAAGDLAAAPGFFNVGLTPGTHTTDAIYCYAAWIEYQRV